MTTESPSAPVARRRFGCLHVLGIIVIVILVTALITAWWVKRNLYASEFKPVQLSTKAQTALQMKMKQIDQPVARPSSKTADALPEPYSEEGALREVTFSEKELNALIAKDKDLARRVAIDLTDDLLSVKLVVPMDQEIPVVGGKTLRLSMGLTLRYENDRPVIIMRGISLGGIPLPSAWWGDVKNKNLVAEFGQEGGFWDLFSKGVEDLRVSDGRFVVRLSE